MTATSDPQVAAIRLPDPEVQATMTVKETASALRLGVMQVYNGVKTGDIPAIRIGGRVLIPTAELRRMLGIDPRPSGETAA